MIRFEIHSKRGVLRLSEYPRFWQKHGPTIVAAIEQWKILEATYTHRDQFDGKAKAKEEMANLITGIVRDNLLTTLSSPAKLVMVVESKANTEVNK